MLMVLAIALVLCLATTSESGAQGKGKSPPKKFVPGEDHLKNKARWEWRILSASGKQLDKGTFMGYVDGRICHGSNQKQVGSWESTGKGSLTATFTWPRLKGAWDLQLTGAKVPTYEGKPKGAKGEEEKLL